MGSVFLARSPDGRQVAVKLVRSEHAADPDFRRLFEREARLARRVARFCTAEVLDYGDVAGNPYLVTEFVDGPTLHEEVTTNGPLERGRLDRLAVAVATALGAIHRAGAVHRDLKPANVLLGPDGPLVIDFGIAQALDAGTELTRDASGTPAFMAPEQARGDRVGPPADVFAWGGVVTFAATGRAPYGTGRPEVLLYRVVHEAPDLTHVPTPLRWLVAAAMDLDPARRPNAAQLLTHLLGTAEADASYQDDGPRLTSLMAVPPRPAAPQAGDLPPTALMAPPGPLAPPPTGPRPPDTRSRPAAGGWAESGSSWSPASTPPPGPSRYTGARQGGNDPTGDQSQADRPLYADRRVPGSSSRPRARHGAGATPLSKRFTRRTIAAGVAALVALVTVGVVVAASSRSAPHAAAPTKPPVRTTAPSASPTVALTAAQRLQASAALATAAAQVHSEQSALATQLALAAYETSPTATSRDALLAYVLPSTAASVTLTGLPTKGAGPAAVSPDGGYVAAAGADGGVRLWQPASGGSPVAILRTGGTVTQELISPTGAVLATVSGAGAVKLWHTTARGTTAAAAATLDAGAAGPVHAIMFSSDGRYLVTGADGGTVAVWSAVSGGDAHPLGTLSAGHGAVTAVALSPTNTWLATGSQDGTVQLWATSGRDNTKPAATFSGHDKPVNAVAFSPDGKLLASAGSDATTRLWDMSSRGAGATALATLPGKGAGGGDNASVVSHLVFSADGSLLATENYGGTTRLWSTGTRGSGKPLATFSRTTLPLPAGPLAFSADATILVATSADGTTLIWDTSSTGSTGAATASLFDTPGPVALNTTGRFLVGTAGTDALFLRDLDPGHLAAQACANPSDILAATDWARFVAALPYQRPCS
jgi:serine/threonine protein kinase